MDDLKEPVSEERFPLLCIYDMLVVSYCLLGLTMSWFFGFRIDFTLVFDFGYDIAFLLVALMFLVMHSAVLALSLRRCGKDPLIFGARWRSQMLRIIQWRRLLVLVKVLFLLKLTLVVYCSIKQAIPIINCNLFDDDLLLLDKILHLGVNPNTFLASLLGHDIVAGLVDTAYFSWYLVKPVIVAYFAILPGARMHIRFFTAYLAIWMIGGLFAVLLPSLGPIYTHPEWFEPLRIPIARHLQETLYEHYQEALCNPGVCKVFIYEGIAAFPSLHVGVVALFAFFILEINRRLGYAMFAYLAVIQTGSVLLGWHYALDGYFTIFLACMLYRVSAPSR
ncbi:MAG: phosphatase PAP2 family protein [Victivallales bacterium]|nr:phosphatase PAP2 family protein [Victivallales bacterium]